MILNTQQQKEFEWNYWKEFVESQLRIISQIKGDTMPTDEHKCPKCGVSAFQHWNLGYMHKCHICGTVWKSETN